MPRSRSKKTTAPRPHLAGKTSMFRLYFFWMRGCQHCEKGKKHIAEFEKLHRSEGAVLRINASLRPKVGKFEPAGVPAYLLCIGEKEVIQHEGMLKLDELEDLLEQGREEYEKEDSEKDEDEDEDVGDGEEPEEEEEEEDSSEDPEHEVVELVGGDDAEDDAPGDEDEEVEEDGDEDPALDPDLGDADPDPVRDESNATVEEESKEALTPAKRTRKK